MPALDTPQGPGARLIAPPEPVEREDTAAVGAGLDALEAPTAERSSWWRRTSRSIVPPLLAIGVVFVVWQVLYWLKVKPEVMLPAPSAVWQEFLRLAEGGQAWQAIWTSLSRGLLGFAMAIVIGTVLGLLVARLKWLRASIGPLLTGLQSLPSVAWVPMAILFFQISPAMIYAVVLLGAVPSVANGLVAGIDHVPPIYTRVGQVLGMGKSALVRQVLLPAALPGYLAGLRQGWAFSWRSLMAAELIVTSTKLGFGLGQLMQQGRDLSDAPMLYSGLLLIFFVGVGIELVVFRPLERVILDARGLKPYGS
ncbi:ABC transporter permease [Nakamurella flava]|uniref:ABC transporter permease n=1 Tax=Nakamurella flava TaxID=2576308 RepID=A0A4U6QM13_9ACTN|nr:ABC transporter permease [Nakamurella flava]TKV61624.1 ABC transporter permease [Nakamurella flava]